MTKHYAPFITCIILLLQTATAGAQTFVSESSIVRQAENTTPTHNWVGYTRNGGLINFMPGPGVVPAGCGSLQFSTPAKSDKAFLYNYDHNGTPLSAITALSYATYRSAGIASQVASINIKIDFNGPLVADGQAILVFEPVYNTSQGIVTNNTWQIWDALQGGSALWWSAQAINGVCAANCRVSWNHIVANNPQAIIMDGFGINQGSGNPGLISAVDALTIGVNGTNTVYNFENAPVVTYYRDADGDSYGTANDAVSVCGGAPAGFVTDNTDCDDTDATKFRIICHANSNMCVSENDLAFHLNHGDQVGSCPASNNQGVFQPQQTSATGRSAVYPNPTNGRMNVQLPARQASNAEIIITEATGILVESRKTSAKGQVERFNLSGKAAGIYFIKVITDTGVENTKLIVQ